MQAVTDVARRFDSATLHESAGRVGALPARLKPAYAGAKVIGTAFPVLAPAGDNLWIQRAIYEASPGEVLVVATTDPTAEFGYWGEILSEAARARRIAGLVIDGGVRDSAQLAEVGLPVMSSSICIRGTGKDPASLGTLQEPVTIGSVVVERGDLVFGDDDGVVVIAASRIADVLVAAEERVVKEAEIISQLRRGRTSLELYNL